MLQISQQFLCVLQSLLCANTKGAYSSTSSPKSKRPTLSTCLDVVHLSTQPWGLSPSISQWALPPLSLCNRCVLFQQTIISSTSPSSVNGTKVVSYVLLLSTRLQEIVTSCITHGFGTISQWEMESSLIDVSHGEWRGQSKTYLYFSLWTVHILCRLLYWVFLFLICKNSWHIRKMNLLSVPYIAVFSPRISSVFWSSCWSFFIIFCRGCFICLLLCVLIFMQ